MERYLPLTAKIFLGLVAVLLISSWARWFISPDAMLAQYHVAANDVVGWNMLKSDMGGYVLTIGIFILLFVFRGKAWLIPSIVAVGAILGTRLLSLLQDGSDPAIWIGIALELVCFAILLWFFFRDRSENSNQTN